MPKEKVKPVTKPKPIGAYYMHHFGTIPADDLSGAFLKLPKGEYLISGRILIGNRTKSGGGFVTCRLSVRNAQVDVEFASDSARLWLPANQAAGSSIGDTTSRANVFLMLAVKTDYWVRVHFECTTTIPNLDGSIPPLAVGGIRLFAQPVTNLKDVKHDFGVVGGNDVL